MKTKPPKQAGLRYTPSTLALTARRELETHSIIWILQWKLSLAYGSDTQQGAEQSLDHMKNIIKLTLATGSDTQQGAEKSLIRMKFTIQPHLGQLLWHALGYWKVVWLYQIYNTIPYHHKSTTAAAMRPAWGEVQSPSSRNWTGPA